MTNEEFDQQMTMIRNWGKTIKLHGQLGFQHAIELKTKEQTQEFGEALIDMAAYLTAARSFKYDTEKAKIEAHKWQTMSRMWQVAFWMMLALHIAIGYVTT